MIHRYQLLTCITWHLWRPNDGRLIGAALPTGSRFCIIQRQSLESLNGGHNHRGGLLYIPYLKLISRPFPRLYSRYRPHTKSCLFTLASWRIVSLSPSVGSGARDNVKMVRTITGVIGLWRKQNSWSSRQGTPLDGCLIWQLLAMVRTRDRPARAWMTVIIRGEGFEELLDTHTKVRFTPPVCLDSICMGKQLAATQVSFELRTRQS